MPLTVDLQEIVRPGVLILDDLSCYGMILKVGKAKDFYAYKFRYFSISTN